MRIKVSNVKFRYEKSGSKELINNFSSEVMSKLRETSKIVGRKGQKGLIKNICKKNGYITLSDLTTVKPTQARDDANWFKEVYKDCENKSLPVILIELVLNRYASYKNRGTGKKEFPRYIEFKKNSVNIKKNYLKYCDDTNTIKLRSLHNDVIDLRVVDAKSVLTHKDTFVNQLKAKRTKEDSKLTTVLWAANMMLDHRLIIPTVKLKVEDIYEAKNFFAIDINKNKANWLYFNMPVNGAQYFSKPDFIAEKEDRLKKIQKAINETLEIKPDQRKSHTISFEGKEYKATHSGRTRLRDEWINAHKDLKREIFDLAILKEIEEFVIKNKLGYAHDDLTTGAKNGSFSQDKLKEYWVSRANKMRFPFELVDPAFTSQECPECNYRSKKNRNGDEFKCTNCKYENQSHEVGAINIGRKAMKNYVH
jgi:transposase